MDLRARRILGWATSTRVDIDFVLGALEQAIWARKDRKGGDLEGLAHHSGHGTHYLSIARTERLLEGIDTSAATVGSSYDTATIATTPPPRHNQPSTKPKTIHTGRVERPVR